MNRSIYLAARSDAPPETAPATSVKEFDGSVHAVWVEWIVERDGETQVVEEHEYRMTDAETKAEFRARVKDALRAFRDSYGQEARPERVDVTDRF